MMLRRLKEDVEKELQPKEETIIEVNYFLLIKKFLFLISRSNYQTFKRNIIEQFSNAILRI